MSVIFRCDRCAAVYEIGFTGQLERTVRIGKNVFNVKVNIRPPHLCQECLIKCMTVMIKDIKTIKQNVEIDLPVAETVGTAG